MGGRTDVSSRRWFGILGALVALLILTAACGGDSGTAGDGSGDDGSADAGNDTEDPTDDADGGEEPTDAEAGDEPAEEEPIVIGAMLDLTGAADFAGHGGELGLAWAVEEINDAGGINGRPIRLVTEDSATSPDGGVLAARNLIDQHEVFAMLTLGSSTSSLAAIPYAEQNGVPFMAMGAGDPGILDPYRKNVFSGATIPVASGVSTYTQFLQDEGIESVALVSSATQAYAVSLRELLLADWADKGIDVVDDKVFEDEDTDFTAQIESFVRAEPEAVFAVGHPRNVGRFLVQADRAGLDAVMAGSNEMADPELLEVAGDAAEGFTTFWGGASEFIAPSDGPMGAFLEEYEERYPDAGPASFYVTWSYADVYVYAEGLRRASEAGELTRESFIEALESLDGFVAGADDHWKEAHPIALPRSFSADDHQGTAGLTLLTVHDGTFVPVD
jgi:branched-chain amino acid transport system substrate-binding protein